MTEEEKKAIETLMELYDYQRGKAIPGADDYIFNKEYKTTGTVLNLIQKQQEEIEKLKNNNKELLRKLRNRVKEVKKLEKYSLYKKEFSRLNKQLKEKDKIIDLMAEYLKADYQFKNKQIIEDIKQYFKNKVEEGE